MYTLSIVYLQHLNPKMPSCWSRLNRGLRSIDLFPNSQLLRYNGDPQYTTSTGGFVSAVAIIIFIILFANMGIKTLKKEIIQSSIYTQNQIQPGELVIENGPGGNFMFGIFVYGIDLNQPINRFFDIKLFQETFTTGIILASSQPVVLQKCTSAHFNFNTQLSQLSSRVPLHHGLCAPIGQKFTVQGKVSSTLYKHIKVNLTRCNFTADATCAPDPMYQAVENQIKQFQLVSVLVNTNVNPGSQNYKNFYFEDKNHFKINSELGISAYGLIEENVIETDVSIMPFTNFLEENVTRISEPFSQNYFLPAAGQAYAEVIFQKSPKTSVYSRNFNKVDAYFSYVGGLVGTIIGLIFIMGFYTQKAYEVSLSRKVFKDDDNQEIKSRNFNILYYFSMSIKPVLDWVKIKPDWPSTQKYLDCCQEVSMQIDIAYIVKRLQFLDAALAKLMEKHQLQSLYLHQKPTLSKVKKQRKKYFSKEVLQQALHQQEENDSAKGKQRHEEESGSKQRIVFEERDFYPTKGKEATQERSPQKPYEQDISAIEFSDPGDHIKQLKSAVVKVQRDNHRGKIRSRQILEDIGKDTLQHLVVLDQSSVGEKVGNQHEQKSDKRIEDFEKLGQSEGKMKKIEEDFDYNFDEDSK